MLKRHNPPTIAPPFSRYSHGVEAPAKARWLHVSGQVGVTAEARFWTARGRRSSRRGAIS
jgi:enamine deaminase RidA (YjgF/YER057c/UK114 family)